MAVDAVPTTLNDHTVAGDNPATRAVCSLVWPQVFQVAPGTTPTLAPAVIDDAEVVSLTPQTVVYHIDPNANWSDGTPISAQDFVYAWLSQNGSGQDVGGGADSVAESAGYRHIASVVGSNGGKTVTVVFQTAYADWASMFDDLLPAHVAQRVGWNTGFDRFDPSTLVSGGPWVVESWTPGQSISFIRNTHWWGTAAHLDRLVLHAVPGAPAMAAALLAGSAQVASTSAFDQGFEAKVSSQPTLKSQVQLGTTILQLVYNLHRAPLDSAAVRQGIAHAVDRAALVTTLVQPIAPLVWEANDHLFANLAPWYADDGIGYVQQDLDAASRALAAGGAVPDAAGTWTWHGTPLILRLAWAQDDPWSALVGPALEAQLVDAGFDVIAQPTSSATLFGTLMPAGNFDLALAPIPTGAYPSRLASAFGSGPDAPSGPVPNWSGFDDPKIDALFVQASTQLAAAQAKALYQQVDSALWTAMPTLPLFAEPVSLAWSASLQGVKDDPGGLGPLWSAVKWAQLAPRRADAAASQPAGGRSGQG